ncbi:MAG: type II CRISPR RNA-guided endonuclease Cas9 [Lysobacteraceae bacterium]|nr:MAG: type II CRISPR RNA-guided endonuclease Cas9 [Xanthomonadaceae bacterium]
MKIPYRLGLDIGTNSIGWCMLRLDGNDAPIGFVRGGVRIFPDGRNPKDLASLAAGRRLARQMRRRHDRVLKRQARFMTGLIHFGLMPEDDGKRQSLSALDPYELRAKGLGSELIVYEVGRALYHLAKRRGFKSSRKDQTADEKETGKINDAIARTRQQIVNSGSRTYGEYLAKRHKKGETTRARLDGKGEYVLYAQRELIAEEFDALWAAQQPFHPQAMTEEARDYLRNTLLFQRPLLPVEPGRCIFEPAEYRIPMCSPLQQRFRILQELNNLRIQEGIEWRSLTMAERNLLRDELCCREKLTFARIRMLLGLEKKAGLNLEGGRKSTGKPREFLKGDAVTEQFSSQAGIGAAWHDLSSIQQEALAVLVEVATNNDDLVEALVSLPGESGALDRIIRKNDLSRRHYRQVLAALPLRITREKAEGIARFRLPDDHGSLSRKALEKIVESLDGDVITYDRAVRTTFGRSHSDFHTGEIRMRLPYYGEVLTGYTSPMPKATNEEEKRWGRLPNPTVHVGLNQLRLVVNEIIRRWGLPQEVIVELAREFGMSGARRTELLSEQKKNEERNAKLNEELRTLGQRENRENRQRLQLYRELGKDDAMSHPCVYTGAQIGIEKLFSSEVEIDHILPYSRSLDDSLSNKVLCLSRANREKRNRTPFDAFGHTAAWESIEARLENLPSNKAKRFREGAMQAFLDRSKLTTEDLQAWGFEKGDSFLARHLTDTAYLSRLARQYLASVCPPNKVWSNTGRLTSQLRSVWGLNELLRPGESRKNRDDHRHHALDAAVIAACDRSCIQQLANAAARAEATGENRKLKDFPMPWPAFREDLAAVLGKIVVSHKADHGTQASLHNDTNYGKRGEPGKKGALSVSHRVPLSAITDTAKVERIADPILREEIARAIKGLSGKELKVALDAFSQDSGVRRVHVLEQLSVIPISDRMTKRPYRYVKGDGNYCYEIWQENGRWNGEIISIYEANRDEKWLTSRAARNGKPLVMRIRKGDLLKVEHEGKGKIMRVALFSSNGIALSEHYEANVDARDRDKTIAFSYIRKSPEPLRKMAARLVGVDALGYVNDPGFVGSK